MTARRSKKSTYSQAHIAMVMVMKKVRRQLRSQAMSATLRAPLASSVLDQIGKCSTPKGWAMLLSYVGGGSAKASLSHRSLRDEP